MTELNEARRRRGKRERDEVAVVAISPDEFGLQLGLSTASVLRACRKRHIRCMRFGTRFLIPADEPARVLREGLLRPADEAERVLREELLPLAASTIEHAQTTTGPVDQGRPPVMRRQTRLASQRDERAARLKETAATTTAT